MCGSAWAASEQRWCIFNNLEVARNEASYLCLSFISFLSGKRVVTQHRHMETVQLFKQNRALGNNAGMRHQAKFSNCISALERSWSGLQAEGDAPANSSTLTHVFKIGQQRGRLTDQLLRPVPHGPPPNTHTHTQYNLSLSIVLISLSSCRLSL